MYIPRSLLKIREIIFIREIIYAFVEYKPFAKFNRLNFRRSVFSINLAFFAFNFYSRFSFSFINDRKWKYLESDFCKKEVKLIN